MQKTEAGQEKCLKFAAPEQELVVGDCREEKQTVMCIKKLHVDCPALLLFGANLSDANGQYLHARDLFTPWAIKKPVYKHIHRGLYIFYNLHGYGWSIGSRDGLNTGQHFIKSGQDVDEPWRAQWEGNVWVKCTVDNDCKIEQSVDYNNSQIINDGTQDRQPDLWQCQTFCKSQNTEFFTYITTLHPETDMRKSCWCKTSREGATPDTRAISGTAICKATGATFPVPMEGHHMMPSAGRLQLGAPPNPKFVTISEVHAVDPAAVQLKEYIELSLLAGFKEKPDSLRGYRIIVIRGTTEHVGATVQLVADLWDARFNQYGYFVLGGSDLDEADIKIGDSVVQSTKKAKNQGTDDFLPDSNDIIHGIGLLYIPHQSISPLLQITNRNPIPLA